MAKTGWETSSVIGSGLCKFGTSRAFRRERSFVHTYFKILVGWWALLQPNTTCSEKKSSIVSKKHYQIDGLSRSALAGKPSQRGSTLIKSWDGLVSQRHPRRSQAALIYRGLKNLPRFVSAVCVSVWHFQTPVRRKSTLFWFILWILERESLSCTTWAGSGGCRHRLMLVAWYQLAIVVNQPDGMIKENISWVRVRVTSTTWQRIPWLRLPC